MPIKALKEYQTQAIDSAVDVLTTAQRLLDAAGNDLQGRKTAIHEYGYLLIEAPTGSGKTLIAGHVVERMSTADRVVWFWFAPFKGVVEQTASTLREEFTTLRVRELSEDRDVIGTQTGDVFVTTWQSVATRMKDNRSIRQSGEQNPSVDDMILSLREQGFRIGVVVDEAHHGFHGEAQAGIFFKGVLEPEYTVLVTATPDDEDIKDMQRKMHLGKLHRIAISRNDAYAQGLIKKGIRCIAWRALAIRFTRISSTRCLSSISAGTVSNSRTSVTSRLARTPLSMRSASSISSTMFTGSTMLDAPA